MRVLLVEPPICRWDVGTGIIGLAEPLSLECLAGAIPEHDVRILDMRLDPALEAAVRSFKPNVVGVGGYTVGVATAKQVLQEVKRLDSSIKTVVGGHHATVQPEDYNEPFIDAIVVGEGEFVLKDLLAAMANGQPLDGVPGLALRIDGKFALTPERPLADLDALPFPARHLVAQYRSRYFRGKWRPIASMYTSRGCPHRCSFCGMWKVNRGKYRLRSAQKIVEELQHIPERYIDFVDDNTFANVQWAKELCALIKASGMRKTFKVYCRADTLAKHPELIPMWREIGMDVALVGFEAIRDADLGKVNKQGSVEQNEKALAALKASGVEIAAYFLVSPDFTVEDFEALKAYIDRWQLLHPVFTILTPFPGTDFYAAVKHQIRYPDYELFDFFHAVLPTRLPERRFYEEFVGLYKYAYSVPRALKYMGRKGFFGLSWRQMTLRKKFFAQLEDLKNRRFVPADSSK